LFINLTPFIPLSTLGEGEDIKKRGFAPLRLPIIFGDFATTGREKESFRGEAYEGGLGGKKRII